MRRSRYAYTSRCLCNLVTLGSGLTAVETIDDNCPEHGNPTTEIDCGTCLDAQVIYQATSPEPGSLAVLVACPDCQKET